MFLSQPLPSYIILTSQVIQREPWTYHGWYYRCPDSLLASPPHCSHLIYSHYWAGMSGHTMVRSSSKTFQGGCSLLTLNLSLLPQAPVCWKQQTLCSIPKSDLEHCMLEQSRQQRGELGNGEEIRKRQIYP